MDLLDLRNPETRVYQGSSVSVLPPGSPHRARKVTRVGEGSGDMRK